MPPALATAPFSLRLQTPLTSPKCQSGAGPGRDRRVGQSHCWASAANPREAPLPYMRDKYLLSDG